MIRSIQSALIVILLVAFSASRVLYAGNSNDNGFSWTDGPISIVVDVSGTRELQPDDGSQLIAAISFAADQWNRAIGLKILNITAASASVSDEGRRLGDRVNGIYFSRQISPTQTFGTQFGFAASERSPNGKFLETDLIFNPYHRWFVYDGPLQ